MKHWEIIADNLGKAGWELGLRHSVDRAFKLGHHRGFIRWMSRQFAA
jgi:hypothetical protein